MHALQLRCRAAHSIVAMGPVKRWHKLDQSRTRILPWRNSAMGVAVKRTTFHLVLIKPTHYDDDGYPITWFRSHIPSNTLAALYGLGDDCQQRQVLGPTSTSSSSRSTSRTPRCGPTPSLPTSGAPAARR